MTCRPPLRAAAGHGRKRIADALLAATLIDHGATEIVTCDPGGCASFEGLRVLDPRRG